MVIDDDDDDDDDDDEYAWGHLCGYWDAHLVPY